MSAFIESENLQLFSKYILKQQQAENWPSLIVNLTLTSQKHLNQCHHHSHLTAHHSKWL